MITDDVWYKSMLMNYVSNATKAAKSKIRITTAWVPVGGGRENNPRVFLFRTEVHDDGDGVSEEVGKKLFKMYGRGQERDDGTGVGLHSVKVQSEALGGGCGFGSSELLRGAVFWFTVAYRPAAAACDSDGDEMDIITAAAGPPTTVLVVDDDLVVLSTVARVLTNAGHTVTTAINGRRGLMEMQRQEYGVVISDLQMPILDGHEMTKRMRQWEQERETCTDAAVGIISISDGTSLPRSTPARRQPIVVMSANATAMDQEQALAAGADKFLAKPVYSRQLTLTVKEHIEAHGQPTPAPPPPAAEAAEKLPLKDERPHPPHLSRWLLISSSFFCAGSSL